MRRIEKSLRTTDVKAYQNEEIVDLLPSEI